MVNKIECYFEIYYILDDEDKIRVASMYLEGSTGDWLLGGKV
jgi:hypothetical protein